MARIEWRALGDGPGFPAWIRRLYSSNASGAYAIRDASTREVLYVGESHRGKLYGTLTRHFQAWSRSKRFWENAGFTRNDPGTTYKRARVEVAVWVREGARGVVKLQDALIVQLRPRDNVAGIDDPGSVVLPF